MVLTFVAQNLKFGGLWDDEGNPESRWPLLLERLQSITPRPDFLLLNEARDWDKNGHHALARAMYDLDMDAAPLAPSNSGQPVALLYRKDTVGRWKNWNTGYAHQLTQSFGVATFDVGLPQPLSVVPTHLTPFSKEKAMTEASLVASRGYRYSPYVVIGGDINYSPAQGIPPDYSQMKPYNVASRVNISADDPSKREPAREVAQMFEKAGYVDAAYEQYSKSNDDSMLQHTCKMERIDQYWVSKPLASSIKSYWTSNHTPGASDHKAIILQLDTALIDTSGAWLYD